MLLNHFCLAFLLKSVRVTGIIAITSDKPLTWLFMSLNFISFYSKSKKKKSFFSFRTKVEKASCSLVFLSVDKALQL